MPRHLFALNLAFALLTPALAAPSGPVIRAPLLGSWLYGRISPIEYYDRSTNRWQDASGASEIVTFAADGSYERTRLLALTTSGCTSKLFIYEKGTLEIAGDRLTYRPREGVNKGYTCSPSNSWHTTSINPETWVFHFEQGGRGQDVLVLRNLKGDAEARYGRYTP